MDVGDIKQVLIQLIEVFEQTEPTDKVKIYNEFMTVVNMYLAEVATEIGFGGNIIRSVYAYKIIKPHS